MNKKRILEKNRVYVECTDENRRVKGKILNKDEKTIQVELPTGFILELTKKHRRGSYTLQIGMLEFMSDGKLIS